MQGVGKASRRFDKCLPTPEHKRGSDFETRIGVACRAYCASGVYGSWFARDGDRGMIMLASWCSACLSGKDSRFISSHKEVAWRLAPNTTNEVAD
jgi:hypothetical protein